MDQAVASPLEPLYMLLGVRGTDDERLPFMLAMESHEEVEICFSYTRFYVVVKIADGFGYNQTRTVSTKTIEQMGIKERG